jgi:2-octaprenyl-6-methoxyphenol hydroxylase
MALLPRAAGDYGCICTVPSARSEEIAALDDAGFVALLQERFGWRAGRFLAVGRRVGYPLRQLVAERLIASRAIVMGNAAQTLHPIGAQGFNLGLRDALTLAELVAAAADPGAADLLQRYAARRAPDREGTMAMSHGLVRLAWLPQPLLAPLRSLALLACDRVPSLQRALARRGMGFRGEPPLAVLEQLP